MHLVTESIAQNWKRTDKEEEIIQKRRKKFNLPHYAVYSLEKTEELWIREFDLHGIQKGVFLSYGPGNQDLISLIRRNERFIGFTSTDIKREDAPALFQGDIRSGLKGLKLYPVNGSYSVSDERLYPLYEIAENHHIPVLIHFGVSIGYFSDLRFGNPIDLHPVARDFPDIPFILAHFGCGFFRETLFLGYQCQNIYVDTSSSNRWMEYLPYEIDLKSVFKKSLKVFGADRLIYGTDSNFFPRGYRINILDDQLRVLDSLGINKSDQAKICGKTMADLLNIRL
ncbi:MAG: amidohydrolase family protein [Theionarchaea archaeon]|nr:amidohydrolase family protein [Theionarchaea archaeon]